MAEAARVFATFSQQAKRAAEPLRHREVRDYALFFAVAYFVQGLGDLSWGLANQPVQYLLKEDMGLTAAQSGFFLPSSVWVGRLNPYTACFPTSFLWPAFTARVIS